MIKIPAPEFIVFYNGDEDEPLKREMRLSDAFLAETNSLELIVTAYNINFGLSQPLIEKCSYLHDYCFFVDKVKEDKKSGLTTEEAIKEAVQYCIENGIMEKNTQRRFFVWLLMYGILTRLSIIGKTKL